MVDFKYGDIVRYSSEYAAVDKGPDETTVELFYPEWYTHKPKSPHWSVWRGVVVKRHYLLTTSGQEDYACVRWDQDPKNIEFKAPVEWLEPAECSQNGKEEEIRIVKGRMKAAIDRFKSTLQTLGD